MPFVPVCSFRMLQHLVLRSFGAESTFDHVLFSVGEHLGGDCGDCKLADIRFELFAAEKHAAGA